MSPVAMMMIHNPATIAIGDSSEMKKAIDMSDEVKESIMNAYEIKTGLSRSRISQLIPKPEKKTPIEQLEKRLSLLAH